MIPVHTIHLPTVHVCTKFNNSRHRVPEKSVMKNFSVEYWRERKTRAVRGSDYSPAILLSEEKDKFVTENWRERKMDQ